MWVILKAACFAALASLLLSGCEGGTVYRTMQGMARQSCLRQPPAEQGQCESRIDQEDYESYRKDRTGP